MLRETGNHVALPRPLRGRAAGRRRKLHMPDSLRAAQNGCCRGRRIEAKKEIQVAIINSCVRFLPGARPSLFPTKKKWLSTFSAPRFSPSSSSLLSSVSLSVFPQLPTLRSHFRPLVCVGYGRRRRGFRAQWSISLLLRASAGAWTLRKFHPLRAVCEEIFSRLCDRARSLNSGWIALRGRGRWKVVKKERRRKQLESTRKLTH